MYQFVHVESYSRTPPKSADKTGKAGRSVKWVVDEAIRDPGAIPHVENPAPPTYVYGEPLEQLEVACEAWAATMTDAKGRKLRKDALCLAAGVVSAPHDIEPEAWASFKEDALKWLQGKYGESLRTVIEHTDESHPHLHFYAVAQPGQRFETVHQGKSAAAEAKADGKPKGQQNQAYKAAMREYQDEFFDQVGMRHGFSRLGPGKRRLTREEWRQEQVQSKALAVAIERAEGLTEATAVEREAIIGDARAKASALSATALKKADAVARAAEKRGFAQGIAATEALPWWRRVRLFVGAVVKERDQLKDQVGQLTEELVQERTEKQGVIAKAKAWFKAGKAATQRVRELEPALADALDRAEDAAVARRQADGLQEALHGAEDRAKHWEAVAVANMPQAQQQPTMHVPGDKKKRFEMPDFDHSS